MSFEGANSRVTSAIYRAERAIDDAARAMAELVEAERALSVHPEASLEEKLIAARGAGSASVALDVLGGLQGDERVEPRPVHVPVADVSDCECAIPAKPAREHGPRCPVYLRWVMTSAPPGTEVHVQTVGRRSVDCGCEPQWRRTGTAAPWPGSHVMNCPRRAEGEMPMAAVPPASTIPLAKIEQANSLIVSHRMPWCRARLLHALGAAEEQGVLDGVLSELLEGLSNADQIRCLLRATLIARGWSR